MKLFISIALLISITAFATKNARKPAQESTDKMQPTPAQEVAANTKTIATGLRKSASDETRMRAREEMDKASTIKGKFEAATAYMYAFEFQTWNSKMEKAEDRQMQFKDALSEIFKGVAELAIQFNKVGPDKLSNDWKNAYAIAATLHRINPAQTKDSESGKYQTYSVYDLIADGLEAGEKVNRGTIEEADLLPYQLEVAREIKTAVWLLRVRHNFLNSYALSLLDRSDSGDTSNEVNKVWTRLINGTLGRDWKPNTQSMTVAEIKYVSLILQYSQRTRSLLSTNGYDTMRTKSVINVLRNIDWKAVELPGLDGRDRQARIDAIAELKAAVTDIVQD